MENILEKLCMGCMEPIAGLGVCPYCKFDNKGIYNEDFLPPGTPLDNRYYVGRLVKIDGESGLYLGYDIKQGQKVWIKEYFPGNLAKRNKENLDVVPKSGYGAQYKALISDFLELSNEVRKLGKKEPVAKVENIIGDNNTAYVIYEYIESISLEEYIVAEGGKLSVDTAKDMLMPIMNAVDNIHLANLIHRGLSPQTLIVDKDHRVYITSFSIDAARTGGSELRAELFSGYSAPEQYVSTGWQGPWTDVYALGAILYRAISGIVPPKSTRINSKSPIVPLKNLVTDVSDTISDAIELSMETPTQGRTQTVAAFISGLLAVEGETQTAVFDPGRIPMAMSEEDVFEDDIPSFKFSADKTEMNRSTDIDGFVPSFSYEEDNDYSGDGYTQENNNDYGAYDAPVKARSFTWLIILLVIVLAVALAAIFTIRFSQNLGLNITPRESVDGPITDEGVLNISDLENSGSNTEVTDPVETGVKDIEVRNFIGDKYAEIEFNPNYEDVYHFEKIEEYNSNYDVGVVFKQSMPVGSSIPKKGLTLVLSVSKGKLELEMPDLAGKELEEAKQELSKLAQTSGITLESLKIREAVILDKDTEEGHVVKTDPVAGSKFDSGDTIIIYVSQTIGEGDSIAAGGPKAATPSKGATSSSPSSGTSTPGGNTTKPRQDDKGVDVSPNDPHALLNK